MRKTKTEEARDRREAIEFQKINNQTIETVREHIEELMKTYISNKNELVLKFINVLLIRLNLNNLNK